MPVNPRTDCPVCGRDVAIDTRSANAEAGVAGTLSRHNNPRTERRCTGALQPYRLGPIDDPADNRSIGISGFPALPPAPDSPRAQLAEWWAQLAQDEIDRVVAKAIEYGATDLRDLGWQVLEMAGGPGRGEDEDILDSDATEIGIAFYAAGKMARIVAAIREGRQPSLDTWHDLGVYARMAQRVHSHGGWPAVQAARQPKQPATPGWAGGSNGRTPVDWGQVRREVEDNLRKGL